MANDAYGWLWVENGRVPNGWDFEVTEEEVMSSEMKGDSMMTRDGQRAGKEEGRMIDRGSIGGRVVRIVCRQRIEWEVG